MSSVSGCVLALAVAACGGGSDEPAAADAETAPTVAQTTVVAGEVGDDPVQTTVAQDTGSTSAGSGSGTDAGGSGTGFIEIGDLRQDLTVQHCVSMAGAIAGTAVGVNDPDNVKVDFTISPEDWQDRDAREGWDENGHIKYSEPSLSWFTGPSMFSGFVLPDDADVASLDITSYDVSDDGHSVTGEATFFEIDALMRGTPIEPAQGSFEFSCPPA